MRGVGDFAELASDHRSTHSVCHVKVNARLRVSFSFSSSFYSQHNRFVVFSVYRLDCALTSHLDKCM